jgi:two-component system chemotaxis response regulator CheB
MRSAAQTVTDLLVGVILTGMGEDGAQGVSAIDAADGHTIAQDRETSAVFGMPKRAIETGAVDDVLPVGEIPARILETATVEVT